MVPARASSLDLLASQAACSAVAADREHHLWLGELSIVRPDGTDFCAEIPEEAKKLVVSSDVQAALAAGKVVTGEPIPGPTPDIVRIPLFAPIVHQGRTAAALVAAVDLRLFEAVETANVGRGRDVMASVINGRGHIAAVYPPNPELLGRRFDGQEMAPIAGQTSSKVEVWPDLAGHARLFAAKRLTETAGTVMVGIGLQSIVGPEDEEFQRQSLLIAMVFAGSVLLTLVGGEVLLFTPLRSLVRAAAAIESGDLSVRSNLHARGEIGALAKTFDRMAEAVADRERELRAANQAAEGALRQAEQANEAKTDFLASMSHEIRTPLSGIISYTELLLDEPLRPSERLYAKRIEAAGSAVLTLVNDLLDFARIEAGRTTIEVKPFSLVSLVDNAVSIVRALADKKRLPITLELDPDLPDAVLGDEPRLRQILLNLLNNAVKFTPAGRIVVRVDHRGTSDAGERIGFSVSDTGIGIPARHRHRLFQRFSQLHQSEGDATHGVGLGLAISKSLVELMGGRIGFESNEGCGSTFWIEVSLPRASRSALEPNEPGEVPAFGTARILVVDDLEMNRDIASAMLRRAGCEVNAVSDGASAIDAVASQHYDLVLMDIQMREVDGITATRRIRQLPAPAGMVPIVAMTANVLPQQVRAMKDAGLNDHVGKPLTRSTLIAAIDRCLRSAASVVPGPAGILSSAATEQEFDRKTFEELRSLLGDVQMPNWLRRLDVRLRSLQTLLDAPSPDREAIARTAHALVSHAAPLGFLRISHICAELEGACRSDSDLDEWLEPVRIACRNALCRLDAMAPASS